MKSEDQIAKEFVIWGTVPEGYETRTSTDPEDGATIISLVKMDRTRRHARVIATRTQDDEDDTPPDVVDAMNAALLRKA